MIDGEQIRVSLDAASKYVSMLVSGGVSRSRAVRIVSRAVARTLRPNRRSRAEQIYPNPAIIPHFGLLWASGGGGSLSSSAPSAPVAVTYKDVLTPIPFSIPITSTVNVSGGGAALQTAVNAAPAGANLVIQDSLAYDPIVISGKTNLTISVAFGQTPSITAAAGVFPTSHSAVKFLGGNSGIKISGLRLIGNGNGNSPSQTAEGIVNGEGSTTFLSVDRVIVEDCVFSELSPANGAPAVQFIGTDGSVHTDVWIHRCVATDCGNNPNTALSGYSTFEVSGFSGVWIQNCKVSRTSVIARAASQMRGYGWKSIGVVVEDCLADDLGTGGENTCFKHHGEAIFGTAVGNSSVRNCVAYNTARAYRLTLAGVTMTVTDSVANIDVAGIGNSGGPQKFVVAQVAGTLVFRDSVVSLVPAEGSVYGDGTVTPTHTFNDIFGGFLDPATPLAPSELALDPVFFNVSSRVWVATAPALQTSASDGGAMGLRYSTGEVIIWAG
jgi:hypothetical protein